VIVFLVGIIGPVAIWIGVQIATERNIVTPRSMFRVLRIWHWISWIAAVLLWVCYLAPIHLKWLYGASAAMFSSGLGLAEYWLKLRFSSSDLTTTPKHEA
jgi:hypothetical protein